MLKLRKNKKGFTLVELIVVIAIMAVLAGVVAGVTVSQLNKQTNKTGQTQAKQIADFIANCALTEDTMGDEADGEKILDANGKFVPAAVTTLINKQYSATSIKVSNSTDANAAPEKGEILVITLDSYVVVKYTPKGNTAAGDGDTYYVTTDGIVSKTAPTASSGTQTETPKT